MYVVYVSTHDIHVIFDALNGFLYLMHHHHQVYVYIVRKNYYCTLSCPDVSMFHDVTDICLCVYAANAIVCVCNFCPCDCL